MWWMLQYNCENPYSLMCIYSKNNCFSVRFGGSIWMHFFNVNLDSWLRF